ncbi:MAG: type II toxin-antitoxin system PemK/MazF family toxin [Chloroflexi bacterium]|nr:type II toxin-antitoxin system PemK/MazF family toxin [Chloroflexota bacterium]
MPRNQSIKRGEIYWVEFDPVKGSEQGGLRPALIVQNNTGNRFGSTTVVAAITRTVPSRSYPFIVVIEPEESGLPYRSAVNCSQLATVHQQGEASRLRPPRGEQDVLPIGNLPPSKMAKVAQAIKYNLAL